MRADGKRVKDALPLYEVAAYFMSKRSDAMNMITLDIPLEPIRSYLNDKKKQGVYLSHMGLFISAYIRTLCEFPQLNRFVVNRRIYSRSEIAVGMVVLKAGDINNETMSKIYFDIDDTCITVQQKIDSYLEQNRVAGETNSTDGVLRVLLRVPGVVGIAVGMFKLMDRFGLLPKSVIEMSPFHESMLISNLASIRTNHIYHHAYDFGTTSLALTLGNTRDVNRRKGKEVYTERCIPVGLVMDERICTGGYFARAFRRFREYLSDPELLEAPPQNIILDYPDQYVKERLRRSKLEQKKIRHEDKPKKQAEPVGSIPG